MSRGTGAHEERGGVRDHLRFSGWFFRFCEAVYERHCRSAERHHHGRNGLSGRHPGGLAALPFASHHVGPTSVFAVGPATEQAIAADHEAVRARAARARRLRPVRHGTAILLLAGVALILFFVGGIIATLVAGIGGGSIGLTVGFCLFLAYGALFFGLLWASTVGRHVCLVRAIDQWGRVLDGAAAIDDPGPVAEWIARNWPWLSPPDFLTADVVWALGSRSGRPVLVALERSEARMLVAIAVGRLTRGDQLELPQTALYRLGVFLSASRLRADAAAQAAVQELAVWGYGVVPTPAGLYVYGSSQELLLRPATLLPVVDKVLAHTDAMVADAARPPSP